MEDVTARQIASAKITQTLSIILILIGLTIIALTLYGWNPHKEEVGWFRPQYDIQEIAMWICIWSIMAGGKGISKVSLFLVMGKFIPETETGGSKLFSWQTRFLLIGFFFYTLTL